MPLNTKSLPTGLVASRNYSSQVNRYGCALLNFNFLMYYKMLSIEILLLILLLHAL